MAERKNKKADPFDKINYRPVSLLSHMSKVSERIDFNQINEYIRKQLSSGVLRKRCSENMQQTYWRTPMPKCNFNKVAKQLF